MSIFGRKDVDFYKEGFIEGYELGLQQGREEAQAVNNALAAERFQRSLTDQLSNLFASMPAPSAMEASPDLEDWTSPGWTLHNEDEPEADKDGEPDEDEPEADKPDEEKPKFWADEIGSMS